MKLITFTQNGQTRIGALKGDAIVDLNATDNNLPTDMLSLLRGGDLALAQAQAAADKGEASIALSDVKLESPVLNPEKILAVGLNYLDHFYEIPEFIREARGMTPPETPVIFNKQTTSANGPFDPILLPPESNQMDYEAELAVVIGKTCRRVSKEQAFDAIVGYTILNDVTIRDWQIATPTMTMGKSWDSHCPMGPALFTKDEIAEPENLNVKMLVNGQERQNFNTKDMIFGIADQIAHLSTAFTLKPGDVIATGTSDGVAMFAESQPWLVEGDVVRVEIEGVGHIENKVEKDTVTSFIK
jgi:2-keto-4-pentenoate hydratase/2-oxohepta-3-ene-1,7-dioic acid hydratase in catechol pathway